jgi:hypothetical protein
MDLNYFHRSIETAAPMRDASEGRDRHRGESHLSSPATPPYVRVRIRRFG